MEHIVIKEHPLPVTRNVDVLVCGGGFGGIAAALAAVRRGQKVLLIEREFGLGGLGTLGLVTVYLPLCDGKGKQVSFSIAEELFHLSIKRAIDTHKHPRPTCWLDGGTAEEKAKQRFEAQYNAWYFMSDVENLLRAEGIEILYGTAISDVIVEDSKIKYAIIDNIDGRTAVAAKTVVDATGNAVVCKMAGEDTAVYGPGNIPTSWYYYLANGDVRLKMFGAKDDDAATIDPSLTGKRFSGLDARENTDMIIYARNKMMDDIEAQKTIWNDPNLIPVATSSIHELRMTRRVDGVETFLYENVEKRIESSIGCIGNWHKIGGGHEIPYGSLFGRKIKNLITAGRCTAADDAGWDLTRVIPACAVTGEAAGVAASITDDFGSLDISVIQNELRKNGVRIHLTDC